MGITSKTGLHASPIKKINKNLKQGTVQFQAIAKPAPFVLKPFANLFNPYPYGCSLLCNHPTDNEARQLLRRAKDTWCIEGKNVLLTEEIAAIRVSLEQLRVNQNVLTPRNVVIVPAIESVPEELFRRYTETDSRPLTPAPTLASGATRASGSRRCVTPDPMPTTKIKEKTLLVLDLRRSHSQETISWYGSSSLQEPPLIRIQHVHTRAESLEELQRNHRDNSGKSKHLNTPFVPGRPKTAKKNDSGEELSEKNHDQNEDVKDEDEEDDRESVKRRGKKKRRRGRDVSRGPPAFQVSLDPETQVSAIGTESRNTSARPSLVPGEASQELTEIIHKKRKSMQPSKSLDIDSYLDTEILRQLRRELNEDIVENELNDKRRKALQEALKTISKEKIVCEELVSLRKELNVPPVNADLWISLPRIFTRSSARFELPMDDSALSWMKPLDYIKEHVFVCNSRKLLYKCVFSKFIMDSDLEETERNISGEVLQQGLDLMMGKPMSEKQSIYINELFGWNIDSMFDFKTFCGISALCERILAPEYCSQLPDRKIDPCNEIEVADFEILSRKLYGQNADKRLEEILYKIKTY